MITFTKEEAHKILERDYNTRLHTKEQRKDAHIIKYVLDILGEEVEGIHYQKKEG